MAQQVSTIPKKQPTKTIKVKEILQSDKIISVSVLMLKSVPESDFTFHRGHTLMLTLDHQGHNKQGWLRIIVCLLHRVALMMFQKFGATVATLWLSNPILFK